MFISLTKTQWLSEILSSKTGDLIVNYKFIAMKKFLIASGIATLAFAAVAMAQGYSFSTNLTVGSTGADVTALQTYLIGAGYNIPAIASGAAAKGYFGSQTQAAVKLFQAAKGVPNTGFVGPLTRGVLNGGATNVAISTQVSCPAGYTCTANVPASSACPAGMTCTPIVGTTVVGSSDWHHHSGSSRYNVS